MVNLCNEVAHSDLSPFDLATLIKDTNEIMLVNIKIVIKLFYHFLLILERLKRSSYL